MENLSAQPNFDLDLQKITRVADIIYFEGPILSLFESEKGRFFLFDWVDRDYQYNRWLIYQVPASAILEFLNRKISHLELFEKKVGDKTYYMDMDKQKKPYFQYPIFEIKTLPATYLPNKDSYFDASDCPFEEKVRAKLERVLSRRKQENNYLPTLNKIISKHIHTNTIKNDFSIPIKSHNDIELIVDMNSIEIMPYRITFKKQLKENRLCPAK